MTKTKKQLRAEAVERLKNCVAARFDAESIVIALTSGRHGQSDWSLECDKLIDLLTDDDANDDSTPENGVSGSEPCVTPESCDSREKFEADPDCSAMLYKMFTENMKHEPCRDYEPKDDVSGYGADFNVVEPNFDNLKAAEMDASRLVVREPDSREKLEAEASELVADYAASGEVCDPMYNGITALLDRQAAITEREYGERMASEAMCSNVCAVVCEQRGHIAELQVKVDELTAERERYREKFGKCLDYADAIHALMDEGLA